MTAESGGGYSVEDSDRLRFYCTMNEDSLSWDDFWEKWTDHDVLLMVVHGG